LNQSYGVTKTQNADKNAAAEMAFQACSSEEKDLVSASGYAAVALPHLRAEMKHELIGEGRISMLDETAPPPH
jgi:hypothetical protein